MFVLLYVCPFMYLCHVCMSVLYVMRVYIRIYDMYARYVYVYVVRVCCVRMYFVDVCCVCMLCMYKYMIRCFMLCVPVTLCMYDMYVCFVCKYVM